MSDASDPSFHLRIDAHALVQLGEQLITDEEQALLELAKNSYDAGATSTTIRVDTKYVTTDADMVPAAAVGLIEIADDGLGMDEKGLRDGWLMVSLSLKRSKKSNPITVGSSKRFPLGDKGLGRLGTMRLGKCLSVETWHSVTEQGWLLTFQWSDIKSGLPLDAVPITSKRVPSTGKTGTIVRIYGLHDLKGWQTSERADRLERRLAELLSPFSPVQDFELKVLVGQRELQFASISKRLRETATASFDFSWNGKVLHISGRLKLIWFRKKKVEAYNQFISRDHGAALFDWITKEVPGIKDFNVVKESDARWFLEFHKDIAGEPLFARDDDASDPGTFSGVIDYFDLDTDIELPKDLFGDAKEYRNLVKALARIYVYRDGFGIRMHRDWIGLSDAWTSGAGFYSLKPRNVIGYFQLSVENNQALIEKSDREGFTDNSASRGFQRLAEEIADNFANTILNRLGKGSVKFLNERTGEHATDEEFRTYDQLLVQLEKLLKAADNFKQQLELSIDARAFALRSVEGSARIASLDRQLPEVVRQKASSFLQSVESTKNSLAEGDRAAMAFASGIVSQKQLASVIRRRIEDFDDRSEALYDMVAVGLSAQALAHDVRGILTNTDANISSLTKMSRHRIPDLDSIFSKAKQVSDGLEAIGQMMSLVQPMLRGRRLIRRKANVSDFVREFFEQRGGRLANHGVKWLIESEEYRDFEILFNPGRFLQILDNLATNSEYWIGYLHGVKSSVGRITIEIRDPDIYFWDNGPGVRDDLVDSIFELFVSGKPRGEGSGLGLFITQQLLLREGCSIRLEPDLNPNGRRFRFAIDLSGAKPPTA